MLFLGSNVCLANWFPQKIFDAGAWQTGKASVPPQSLAQSPGGGSGKQPSGAGRAESVRNTRCRAWAQNIYRRHHRAPCWSSSRDWKRRRLMASSQKKISVRQGSVVNWRTAASTSKCLQGCGLRWRRKGWQWSTRRGRTTVAATATNPARGPEASIHAIDGQKKISKWFVCEKLANW